MSNWKSWHSYLLYIVSCLVSVKLKCAWEQSDFMSERVRMSCTNLGPVCKMQECTSTLMSPLDSLKASNQHLRRSLFSFLKGKNIIVLLSLIILIMHLRSPWLKNSVHNFFYSFFCGLNSTCIVVCICICYVDCHDLEGHEVIIGLLHLRENLDWSHNEENGDISFAHSMYP